MAIVVIDLFEVIDIQEEKGKLRSVLRLREFGEFRMKGLTVGQACQLVGRGITNNLTAVFRKAVDDKDQHHQHQNHFDHHQKGELLPLLCLYIIGMIDNHEKHTAAKERARDNALLLQKQPALLPDPADRHTLRLCLLQHGGIQNLPLKSALGIRLPGADLIIVDLAVRIGDPDVMIIFDLVLNMPEVGRKGIRSRPRDDLLRQDPVLNIIRQQRGRQIGLRFDGGCKCAGIKGPEKQRASKEGEDDNREDQ